METSLSYVLLVITSFLIAETVCKCPPDDPSSVHNYVLIPEENYDRNFSSISVEGKRPLGFDKDTWYFNQPDEANPCIKVTNAQSRRLEIMFETFPQSRLCINIKGTEKGCSDPGTGKLYRCLPRSADDTVHIEFQCDIGCDESNVQFWYRIVLGVQPADDPEDRWCEDRSPEYPESLRRLPDGFSLNQETTTPFNGASGNGVTGWILVLLLISTRLVAFLS